MGKPYFVALLIPILLSPFTSTCSDDTGGSRRACCPSDIQIYQWPSGYTGLHEPEFTVVIVNEAWLVDGVFDVQISCGEFASTKLINPMIFRRIGFGKCLLKDGKKISPGEVISFQYSNVLPYTFSVVEVKC
ncbi:unnamed protein product [Ilex paraguariensis]|uniref:TPD1 protein homolog 1-like n=1 Tax=Ilex paraguariensis TaxID=185542 RepID=A0ABC8UZ22_9AQUA